VNRFFHNRAVSEEVVQEIFIRVWKARKKYERRAKFTTWLYTIATRTCLNELRRGVHKKKHDSLDREGAKEPAGEAPRADEMVQGERMQKKVEELLGQLPENQRAAFVLVRFGGRSYAEVAQILGISQSAVKSVVFRATEALRRGLEGFQTKE
jgi:RNA polymerase sigma-70 factor (ECF subfamily)